ncbi:hypothetical protein ACFZCG_27760 [Streptomyces tanashiensis]|uniref:hypothetical protein n=1 Tax=Streptomyces tanashiensis TaxID=67367 RepID=UPI0036EBA9AA
MNAVSGFLKLCGVIAVAVGGLWFISSCGTAAFGEPCVPGRIKPSRVCANEGGAEHTYAEVRAAKHRGRQQLKISGTTVAVGIGMIACGGLVARRPKTASG